MSLAALLNYHYFTLQTNEGADNVRGGLNRKEAWMDEAVNLKGHFQSVEGKREELNESYGRSDLEVKWILFHNYTQYDINTGKRLLIMKNPFHRLNKDVITDIRVFKVISRKEPVALRNYLTLFEIYLYEITRQTVL